MLSFWFADETVHRWPVLMLLSDGSKLLSRPASWALLTLFMPGCSLLFLPIVVSLIQARMNVSTISIFSQTAKHTITTTNTIFGKKWLILIGIPIYIATLWWLIGRVSYWELKKNEPSTPQYSEHDLNLYKNSLLYGFSTMNSLTKFKTGRTWTSCGPRRFGRWRKH